MRNRYIKPADPIEHQYRLATQIEQISPIMMNAVVMCAFAALCVMHGANANLSQLQIQAQRMKNEINSIQNELNRAQRETSLNFDRQIINPKLDGLQGINNVVNPFLNNLRKEVNEAKDAGKNAEQCYENARIKLRDLSKEGQATIDRCANLAKITVQTEIDNMKNLHQHGNTIKSDIDMAFMNCYSSNILQMENCITLKLAPIRMAINGFRSTTNSLKSDATSTLNSAISEARSCFNYPPGKIRNELPSIKSAADHCIQNA